jgi:hypothetical protein
LVEFWLLKIFKNNLILARLLIFNIAFLAITQIARKKKEGWSGKSKSVFFGSIL